MSPRVAAIASIRGKMLTEAITAVIGGIIGIGLFAGIIGCVVFAAMGLWTAITD